LKLNDQLEKLKAEIVNLKSENEKYYERYLAMASENTKMFDQNKSIKAHSFKLDERLQSIKEALQAKTNKCAELTKQVQNMIHRKKHPEDFSD